MAAQDVRYCMTADGIRIAYCVEGEGPPLLVLQYFVQSFSVGHYLPEEDEFWRVVAQRHQIVRFDMRGTGLSQRGVKALSLAAFALDIEAVLSAVKLRRVALWTCGPRGPIGLAFAAMLTTAVAYSSTFGMALGLASLPD